MKITGVIVLALLILLPVGWQLGMTATDPKTEKVLDASVNLRVPGDYRTAYRTIGSAMRHLERERSPGCTSSRSWTPKFA